MATRTITGAKLVDNKANDADSFMVDVGGDTMHLRLYFGDAGETNYKYPERVITQRNSFGLDETADVIALGEKGKGLAMDWLSGKEKWEILTKDERARGKDKELGTRTLASIRFPDKAGTDDEYLVQRLMKAGVLRVGSSEADDIIPGTLGSDFTKQLRDLSPVKPNKAKKGEAITFGPNELMANPLFQKASLEDRVKLIDGYFDMAQNIIDANDDGTSVNDATTMRQIKAKNFELVMANLYQGVHEKLIDKGLGEEEAKQETLRLTSQDGKTDEPSYSYPRPGLTGYDLQTQRAYLENPKLQEEFGRFDSQPKAQQEAMRKLFMSMEEVHGSEIAKTAQVAIDTMKSRALINETRDLDSSTSVFVKDHYDPRVRDKVVVKMQDRKREKEIYLEMDKADYLKDNGVSEIVKRLPERGYLGVVADNVHGFNSMITGSPAAMLAQADRIGGLIGSLPGKATDKLLGDGTAQKIAEMIPWGTDGSPILGNAGDWLQRQLTEPQRFLEKESLVSQDKRTSNLKLRQEAGEKTFFGLVTKGTIAPALGQAAVSMVTTMGGAGLGVKFLAAKGAQAIGKTTAGAAATGATGASLGASFLEIGNQEYKEGVAFGLEPDQALLYSIPIALAQTPTDAIADVFVAGKFAGQAKNTINQLGLSNKLRRSVAFTGRVLAKSAVEGGTEATQAVQSAMGAKAFYDANKEIFDWAQIKEEGALGAIVGANIALISDQGVQAKQKPGKRNIDPKLTKAVFDFIDEADPGAGEVELTNEYVDPASGEALVSPNEFANIVKGLDSEHPLRQFPEKDVFETYRRVTYQGEYELQEEADSNDSERSQDFTAAERAELKGSAFGSVMHDFESGNIEKEDILPKLVEVYQEMIKGNEDLENQSGEYMGLLKNLANFIETGKVVRKVGEAVKPEAVDTSTPDGVAGTPETTPTQTTPEQTGNRSLESIGIDLRNSANQTQRDALMGEASAVIDRGIRDGNIKAPNGSPVITTFTTAQGSIYMVTEDGQSRRFKSWHQNTGNQAGQTGLQSWTSAGNRKFVDFTKQKHLGLAAASLIEKGHRIRIVEEGGNLVIQQQAKGSKDWSDAQWSDAFPAFFKNLNPQLDGRIEAGFSNEPTVGKALIEWSMKDGRVGSFHPGSEVSSVGNQSTQTTPEPTPEATPAEETNILESTSLKDLETLLESEQKKQEDNKKTLIAAGAAVMEANDKGVRFPTLYKNLQDEEAAAAEEVARSEENIKQISEEIAAIKTAERKGIDQLSIPEEGAAAPPRSAEGFAYRKARLAVPDPTRMPEQKAATGFSTPEEGATPPRSTGGFSSRRTEPAPEPAPEAAPEAAPEQSAKRGPAARKSVRGKGRSKADQQKLDEYVATLEYVPSNEARRRGSASPFEATEQSSKEELKEEFFASRDKDSSEKPDILLLAKLLTHRDVTEAFAAKIDNEAQASIDLEDTEKGRRKLLEDAVNKRAKLNDWEDTLKEQYPGDTPERGLIYYLTKLAKEEDVDKALNERFNQAIQERLDPGGEATRERVDLSLPPPYEGPKVITDGKEVKPGSRRYRRLRSVGDVYKQRLTEQGIPTTVTERSEAPRAPISKPKPGSQSNYQVAPNEAMAAVRKLAEATKASMSVFTMSDPKQTSISPHTKGALDVLDVLGKEYKDGAPVKPEASTETAAKRIRETADMKRRPPIGDRDVPKPPTEAFVGEPSPSMSLLAPGSQPWEENPSKTKIKSDDGKVVEFNFNPRPWIEYLSLEEQNEFADLAFNIKRLNKDLKTLRDAPKAKEEDVAIKSLRTDINNKQKKLQALVKKADREASKESEFAKVEAAPYGAKRIDDVISTAVNKFLEPFKDADLSSWSPADTADLLKLIDETMLKAGDVTVTQKGDKQGARKRVDPNRKKSVIVTWPIAGKSYETKFNDVPLAVAEDATSGERSADASIDNINTVYRSQIIKGLRKAIFKEKSDKAYVWSKPSVKNHYRIPTENEVKAESAEGEIRSNFKDVFGNVKTTQGLAGSPLRYPSKDGLLKQRSGETKSEITAEEALNQRREEDEQTESDGQPLGRGKSLQSWMTPDEAYFAWYESLLESVSTQIGKFNSTIAEAAPEYQIFNPFAQGQSEYKPGQATIGDAMEYIIGKVKVGPAVDIEKTGVPTVDGRTIIKALGEVSSYLPRPRRSMKPTLSSEPGMQNQIEPESLGDFKKRWDSYNKKKLNGATIGMLYKRYLNQGGTFKEAYDMFEMKDGILQPKDSAAELPKGNPVERNMPGHFMNQLNPSLHKAVVQILGKDADQHLRRAYNAYYEVLSGAYTGVTRGDVRDSAVRGLEGKALATARAQGFTPEMLGLSPEVSDGDYQEAFFNAFQTAVERMEVATTETFYDDQNADGNFNADDDVDAINEASTESAFYGARPSDLRLSAFRLNTFMKRVRSGAATGMTLANELLKPTGREPKAFDQLRYSKPWPVEKLETVPTRPQDPVPTPISNLIAELKAIADLNQIIVRAGDPEMNTLGFVPQPKFLGNAVIELHPRVAEEVKGKFVMLEELIHAISYKQNASTIAAKDALDQWNIHAKTADLRKKLGQSPDTISTDDLKELYNNKTISESEYVALYAMSSTQEAVAHSFISPSFATMMSSVGVDVADIINGAFPNKPGLAAAAEAYRNSVYAAIPSDPATILQATMNENNGRRGGSASPYAPTTDQKALSAEAFISDDPLQFLKDNKASITYAEAGYSPEEKQIFDERIDGIRDILLNSNPDLTNELLADRYRAAVSSLFLPTSALKSRSIAWNLAMDLESDKHVKEFRARAQKSKLNVQATTGWVSSQRYTQNLIKRVTRNLNNYKMVKEFFLNLQYGKTNPLSGGGRNTHLSRKGLFDRQVQEKKKQLKLKPEETRFAVFANQLFSIRERSYYENLAESTPDMTADQLEMRAIANNIQFQEASILHKLQIGAKIGVEKIVMDGETEADFLYVARTRQDYANMKAGLQWKPQLKPWVKEMLKQPNQEAAKKYLLRKKVLSPQQDAYRKFIIDEFAKLKPEYRYITEVVRGQEWEGYRDYIPLVVDDAQPQNAKQTGPVNLMDNDIQGDFGSSGKMDALPTSPNDRTGIASSSLQRRGIPMDSQFYYRSPSFSQISSAYGSQSYEIATLAERKLVGAMTKANWSSERPQSTTRPLVDNAERQYLSPDHTVKSKMAAMDNINAVVLAVATKQYNNDRSGSDQHQGLKAFREAQQLGYHIALSAVDQAFIQTFPLLAGWMGYTAGPGSLNRWARLGPAVATIHSAEGKTFFEFLRNYDPALLDRTANSDVDMFKKAEDVIYQKGRISNAPLKMKNGALVVTNHAAELMIAKPEAFVLRPMVYVEYMTRAAKNSNGRFKYGDVELLTTNVDLKALSETQEMVNHIAAASDPADKGTAFTANDWKGEAAKIGFLSFGGHFNSQSNLAELAGVQMWDGIVNRDVNELAGGMQKLLSWTAQAIVYNILKYGIKYLKLLAAAPAIGAIGLFLAKLAGAGEDEVKELVEKQKKKLEAFRSRSFKEHAAAVTYLTSADVVGPALGPGFGAPVFQGLLKGAIDHSKNEYLVPELNKKRAEEGLEGKTILAEANLLYGSAWGELGGPGIEAIASVAYDEDVGGEMATGLSMAIPERNLRKWFQQPAQKVLEARAEKKKQEKEKDPNYKTNLRRVLDAL